VLAHLYDALRHHDGRRLADLKGAGRISPQDWQIPVTQWDTIAQAASNRAEAWGTGAQLRADLLDRTPGVFDDPTATTDTQPPPRSPGRGLRLLCVSVRERHIHDVTRVRHGPPSTRTSRLGPRTRGTPSGPAIMTGPLRDHRLPKRREALRRVMSMGR
jgi:hypothetical protein